MIHIVERKRIEPPEMLILLLNLVRAMTSYLCMICIIHMVVEKTYKLLTDPSTVP
jgi:hypothetical protein